MNVRRPDSLTIAAFVAVALIGGANFVAVRFSNRELPPFWGASVRFAAAALLLFSLVLLQRLPLPRGRALAGALIYGALGFGAFYAFAYWGLVQVSAGLASIVASSAPLLTLFFAVVHGLESFRWRAVAGSVLALSGIAVMFSERISFAVPLTSLLAIVLAATCAAESGVVAKRFQQVHPIVMNAVGMAIGAVILFALSMIASEPVIIPNLTVTWVALAYLVFIGSSTLFILYLFILKRWTASATSYLFVLFPLVAVALSAWLDDEPLTWSLLTGGALVLAGVYVGALAPAVPSGVPKVGEPA